MWFLSFIPDSLLHGVILSVLCTGAVLYLFSLFINLYPPAYPFKEPIKILATVLMIIGVYGYGSYDNEMSWRERVKEAESKVAAAKAESAVANSQLETKIITRTKIIRDNKVVVKKEIQIVKQQIDTGCKLDPVVPKIHNDAARDPFKGNK
jgi:hypothetical protein